MMGGLILVTPGSAGGAMSPYADKKAALKVSRTLNPRPDVVVGEGFASCPFVDPDDLLQVTCKTARRVRVDKVLGRVGDVTEQKHAALGGTSEAGDRHRR
ncbi:hypothetical protein J7E95_29685 [Streptomyces sp. ISL-14]|nr:hypothetical protein [Streptomyces sp. ISL-14]